MDDEIDEVARSMTAAPPSPALRSGVRARMAGRPGGSHALRWSLGLAAAAAVIVLAIVWPGPEPASDPVTRQAVAAIPPATANTEPPEPASPKPVGEVRPTPVVDLSGERPPEVEMLELPPLMLEPLAVPLLALEGWDVEPLARQP